MPTIAAIATPRGTGGIGIIKISGKDAVSAVKAIFVPSPGSCTKIKFLHSSLRRNEEPSTPLSLYPSFKSRHLYYGHIKEPESQRIIDEVLLAVMYAPRSYTGEDVVEIQAHSGSVVLRAILELILNQGARLAEPGEFTKRAYLNGRIDLTQAEAVMDMINARSDKALQIASSQIRGELKNCVESVRNTLLSIMAEIEAAIDFPDDVKDNINIESLTETIQKEVIDRLNRLICHYKDAHFLRDGLNVVIVGKPNVGKSSIMNCLLQKDRAIVTPVPGTTRDIIEESLNIEGIPLIISDTAGLHESDDPVEAIGMKKSREALSNADMILFIIDAGQSLTHEDYAVYEAIADKKHILVMNKSDLIKDESELKIPDNWNNLICIKTSALYKTGIDELKSFIAKICTDSSVEIDEESGIIPNLRHKIALENSLSAAFSMLEGIKTGIPFELISIDIQDSIDALGEITGVTTRDDLLDQIFSRFCIGK